MKYFIIFGLLNLGILLLIALSHLIKGDFNKSTNVNKNNNRSLSDRVDITPYNNYDDY